MATTGELLGEMVEIMQATDSYSPEVMSFLEKHGDNSELQGLGRTSMELWDLFRESRERADSMRWWKFWRWLE